MGFGGFGISSLELSRINLGISMSAVAWPNFLNGFCGGFIFVPLTILAMGRLRKEEMGNAASIYNLVRNVGGSIGIAALTTAIVRGTQKHQAYLGAHLTASSPVPMAMIHGLTAKFAMGGADAVTAHREALGAVYSSLQQQSAVLAYADNFRLMGYLSIACIPLALMLARPREPRAAVPRRWESNWGTGSREQVCVTVTQTLRFGADQQAGDVVVAAGLVGCGDQPRAQLVEGNIDAQDGLDERIGELAGEAVGAEQKQVAGFGFKLEDVGSDAALRAQSARDDVAQRGTQRFSLAHLAHPDLLLDQGMIEW